MAHSRSQRWAWRFTFWKLLSVVALVVATTGVAACINYFAARGSDAHSAASASSAVAVLRILVAPLFALAFLESAVLAPSRNQRLALLVATALEAAAFACVAFIWFCPFRCPDTVSKLQVTAVVLAPGIG